MFYRFINNRILRKTVLFAVVLLMLWTSLPGVSLSAKADDEPLFPIGPELSAKSALVMDMSTGVILYKQDAYTGYQAANLAQLMTCLLAAERCDLTDIMTMSREAEENVSGSRVGLTRKETLTIESALYAVMLASGNEVAYGLAEHVSKTKDNFLIEMNAKAKSLGCINTNFTTAEGADDENYKTCAYDLALIGKAVFENADLKRIAGSSKYTIPATNLKEARPISNRHLTIKGDKDFAYDYATAGKVGYSSVAGHTSVTLVEKDGLKLICVLMGCDTKETMYKEMKKICGWCFDNYSAYNIQKNELGGNTSFASVFNNVSEFKVNDSEAILYFDDDSVVVVPSVVTFSEISKSVMFYKLSEYYHGENIIGMITYTYGGTFVGSAEIKYYNEAYPLNSEVIKAHWPAFLFTVEEVRSPEHAVLLEQYISMGIISPTPTPEPQITITATPTPTPSEAEINNARIYGTKKKIILGSGIGVVVILLSIYLVTFEIPYQKKKRE